MSIDPEELETTRALETIAGERCPCGHHIRSHEPPDLADASMGACKVPGCECRGVIVVMGGDLLEGPDESARIAADARGYEAEAAAEARGY